LLVVAAAAMAAISAIGCGRNAGTLAVGRAVHLEGEVVDPQCYFMHDGHGLAHRSCALYCARGGQDLAFLERTSGRVYPIVAARHGADPNDGLLGYVGYPVSVNAVLYQRDQQQVLVVERLSRLDGGAPAAVDSVAVDPAPHDGAPRSAPDTARHAEGR
jgi:hypothetical protein